MRKTGPEFQSGYPGLSVGVLPTAPSRKIDCPRLELVSYLTPAPSRQTVMSVVHVERNKLLLLKCVMLMHHFKAV